MNLFQNSMYSKTYCRKKKGVGKKIIEKSKEITQISQKQFPFPE
ncbi:hypothetical protein HMPREF6123_0779 [Oribacterium sinus F0268]|uniref:Uncharacterized protein n=1 Tax=Oribacterium sinus F0268 TaxID=585501 RepID=C2KWB0_9FIRM|nr:hypothetical protein HMPREF6123_0779 [Oribacterium sinus F0268]